MQLICMTVIGMKSVLFLYAYGGPDHALLVHLNSTVTHWSLPQPETSIMSLLLELLTIIHGEL